MWLLPCKSYSHFFSKKFQHICVSLDVNFNISLTNDVVSFEQLGPECVNGEQRTGLYFAYVQGDLKALSLVLAHVRKSAFFINS